MSYKNEAYFKDVLINEVFYVANKNGSIINWTDDKIHQSNFYVFE
ncbi:hypothetical protein [Staphylococcus haemolyticus]|nr:hypothetical protein [Staphylococcus haemolyticus]